MSDFKWSEHAECPTNARIGNTQCKVERREMIAENAGLRAQGQGAIAALRGARDENARLRDALTALLRYCSLPIEDTHYLLDMDIFAKARAALSVGEEVKP
jgi:hypothetical protein